jgi:hypothetical protein
MEKVFNNLQSEATDLCFNFLIMGIALVTGCLLAIVIFKIIQISIKAPDGLVNQKLRLAFYLFVIIISFNLFLPFTRLSSMNEYYIHKLLYTFLIFSLGFILIKLTEFIKVLLYNRFDISKSDNLQGRKARTQIDFLQKLAVVVIIFVALSIVLMS